LSPIALADAYIQDSVSKGTKPFRVAWYTSDTTYSIQYLQSGLLDVGITYNPAAEKIAIDQGIALSPSYYAFRDHFLLAGPRANPANVSKSTDIYTMFSQIRQVAENEVTTPPVRFLSRYDKSATNIKDSLLWVSIGQVCLSVLLKSTLPYSYVTNLSSRSLGLLLIPPGITNTLPSPSRLSLQPFS
jgi:ABC-type tungstate transport system permease subunit